MNNLLKNKLKSQYENLSEEPSQDLWSRLEMKLDEKPKEQHSKKNISFVLKIAAAVLVVISIGFIFKWSTSSSENMKQPIAVQNIQKNQKESDEAQYSSSPLIQNKALVGLENEDQNEHQYNTQDRNRKQPIIEKKSDSKEIKSLAVQEKATSIKDSFKVLDSQQKSVQIAKHEDTEQKNTKYVTADELLFGREVEKTYQEQRKNKNQNLGLSVQKPKEVKVLGFTVYSKDE